MVRGRDWQEIGLEFGYLVDSKQIDKKQAKSLGQQVLFSIQHSKLYKKLLSSKPPPQSQPPNTISQLQFTLSQKSLRIQQLESTLQSVQQQLMIFTEQEIQNSRLRGAREMRQEIERLRVELGDARQQRDEALTMLGTKERLLAELRDEKERMAGEIRMRNEELVARDRLIQSLRVQISSLRLPVPSSVSVSQHIQHPNPFLLPIQSQEYYPYIISVFQHPQQKYYHHTSQQLIQAEYMAIALDPLGYKLDHSLVMFDYRVFTQYVWGNLEVLLLEYCNVTNGIRQTIAEAAGCLPILKILSLKNNPLNRVKPNQLDSFPELRQLTLDKSQFSETEKTALKTYTQTRDLLSILFE